MRFFVMTWPDQLIHFIDFEGSSSSGIVEYGVVSLHGGRIVAARGRLCRPVGRVRPEDQAVHGLDAEGLAGAAPFADEFELFAGLRAAGAFAAHFANAENTLLKGAWPYGRGAPDWGRTDGGVTAEWGPWIDTGRLFPQLRGDTWPTRLADLVRAEGEQENLDRLAERYCEEARRRYHAALYDALAGALLLTKIAGAEGWGDKSLRWLVEQSTLDPERREKLRQGELF